MSKTTRQGVAVTVLYSLRNGYSDDSYHDNSDWIDRLFTLGTFLCDKLKPLPAKRHVTIHAYEDKTIGGLRLSKVDIGDYSYVRYDDDDRAFLFNCEDFIANTEDKEIHTAVWLSIDKDDRRMDAM